MRLDGSWTKTHCFRHRNGVREKIWGDLSLHNVDGDVWGFLEAGVTWK